jgi:hypothetical protein
MRRQRLAQRRIPATLAVVVAAFGLPPLCRADVMYSGDGVSSYVNALGPYGFQVGSTPASASGTANVNYTLYPLTTGSATATATAWALATPGGTDLLQVKNYLSSNGPQGPFVGAFSVPPESTAAASWNNVQATVTGPAGTALPDSIRLEFQVTYQTPTAFENSFIVNGLGWPAFPPGLSVNGAPFVLTSAGTALQAGEQPVQALANGSLTGFFHLDLPLSALGTSQQFSLSLGSDLAGLGTTLSDTKTLSLAGIYLPDGTPISADGYSVSFESGLPPPPLQPVPEPGALAMWVILAGSGAAWFRRRKSRCSS